MEIVNQSISLFSRVWRLEREADRRETIGLAEELRNIALSAVVADQC